MQGGGEPGRGHIAADKRSSSSPVSRVVAVVVVGTVSRLPVRRPPLPDLLLPLPRSWLGPRGDPYGCLRGSPLARGDQGRLRRTPPLPLPAPPGRDGVWGGLRFGNETWERSFRCEACFLSSS